MTTPLNPEWLQEQLDRADRLEDTIKRNILPRLDNLEGAIV